MPTGQIVVNVPTEPVFFCGVSPQALELAARRVMRWAKREINYCWIDRVPGLTAQQRDEDSAWAFAQWAAALNGYLRFAPVTSTARADIILTTRPIDGANGVLAETELPPGDDRQIRGWFDNSESWNRSIIFRLVFLHETGHSLGFGHLNSRTQFGIMRPIYDASVSNLQRDDIESLLAIYPEARNFAPVPTPGPITPPTPVPVPTPLPGSQQIQINIAEPLPAGVYTADLKRLV